MAAFNYNHRYTLQSTFRYTGIGVDQTILSRRTLNTGTSIVQSSVQAYKVKIKRHLSATSTRSITTRKFSKVKGSSVSWYRYTVGSFPTKYPAFYSGSSDLGLYSFPSAPSDLSAVPQAVQNFYQDLYKSREKFEGATVVVNLRKALGDLKHPYQSLLNALRGMPVGKIGKYARGDVRGFRRGLAGCWLGVMYGLKPDIEDIAAAMERAKKFAQTDAVVEIHGSAGSLDLMTNSRLTVLGTPDGGASDLVATLLQERRSQKSTSIIGAVIAPGVQSRQAEWGFDPASWVLAGWDVIPWSFLVDYVADVSGFIEACAGRLTTLAWSSQTTVSYIYDQLTESYTRSNIGAGNGTVIFLNEPARARAETKRLERSTVVSAISLPGINIRPSVTHLLNTIALLVSSTNGRMARTAYQRGF